MRRITARAWAPFSAGAKSLSNRRARGCSLTPDPTVRRWILPQELYSEYQWKQWEYSNYARENYQRYVSTSLEGNFFYDFTAILSRADG